MEEVQNFNQDDYVDAPIQQQPYNITTGKKMRVINRPERFANVVDENLLGYANCEKFALLVAETIGVLDINSYKKSIPSSEADRWVGAMGEKIESLHKNRT